MTAEDRASKVVAEWVFMYGIDLKGFAFEALENQVAATIRAAVAKERGAAFDRASKAAEICVDDSPYVVVDSMLKAIREG